MQRRTLLKAFALSASVVAMGMSFGAQAADTIKVGIMHSLSGTMAISETPLKDVALMTIDEINAKGGVLGKKLEPVVAFSVGEEELRGIDTKPLVGNLAAWNYFESVDNPTNQAFVADYKAYAKAHKLPNADTVVTNDPMEATYVGIHMWAQAVEKAGTTDVEKVRAAMAGQTFKAPSGFTLTMDATNHHLHKPVMIGEIEGNGQFNVVWQTEQPVRAQPWSPFIAGNDKKPDQPMKTASN